MKYHMHYNKYMKPYLLDDIEHCILTSCKHFSGSDTTNSAIKVKAKVSMPEAQVGLILSRLRAVKLIDYWHVQTGRRAAGSGRYELEVFSDYFGEVLKGEEEPLP